ncbi:hypothetical protein GBF38_003564 [Nibea albiflora]|uniref:Uncharacterized protein n=1 Tax=Nibea albiflora TaxID=240163 RepID=A0ACB7FK24_NIBAL|nr:hypothetical protein GBF38_003564 [Nibea albiflora]
MGSAKGGRGGGQGQAIKVKSPTSRSSPSLNGLAAPDSPGSSYRRITGPPAVRQSVGKLGVWPPAQAEEGKINQPEVSQRGQTPTAIKL